MPKSDHKAVAEANQREHAAIAVEYAPRTRQLVRDPRLWDSWYFDHLRQAIATLRSTFPGERLRILDALGGTGKVALFFQATTDAEVYLCDITPEMVAVYERICAEEGFSSKTVVGDIVEYLKRPNTPQFHMITASSALHHVVDYEGLLALMGAKLRSGGFIHTAWDPLPISRSARRAMRAEYYVNLLFRPRTAVRGLMRRLERRRQPDGVHHEFHRAIDDRKLICAAEDMGFAVVIHHRNVGSVLRVTRPLWRRLGIATTFALLLQKSES